MYVLFCDIHPYGGDLLLEDKKCTCASISPTDVCNFCIHVKCLLNLKSYKLCMEKIPESILDKLELINEYLETLKGCEPFFVFNRSRNMILITLDNPQEPNITGKIADYCYRSLKKMLKYTNFTCNYIPECVSPPETLPWYEKDFSCRLYLSECERFLEDTNDHFQKTKVVNFDIIHRQALGEKVPGEIYKECV